MQIKKTIENFFQDNPYHLSPQGNNQIKKTVLRYSSPSGFCGTLSWITHRIKNVFLSLIGCSDWQRSHKLLKGSFKDIFEADKAAYPKNWTRKTEDGVGITNRRKQMIQSTIAYHANRFAKSSLNELVCLQNDKQSYSSDYKVEEVLKDSVRATKSTIYDILKHKKILSDY